MIAELDYRTRTGRTIYPDGTLKDALRQDWGYWESKDEADDLDTEIQKKFAKGYPCNNILFEDTQTAVLYQACEEVARVNFMDAAAQIYNHQEKQKFLKVLYENFYKAYNPKAADRLGNRVDNITDWALRQFQQQYATVPRLDQSSLRNRRPTIREKFNTYRFIDYKEQVIDLLTRVCTVSVETMRIINQMPDGQPGES